MPHLHGAWYGPNLVLYSSLKDESYSTDFPAYEVPIVLRQLLPPDRPPLRRHVARLDLGALGDRGHGHDVHGVAVGGAQLPTEDGDRKSIPQVCRQRQGEVQVKRAMGK